MIIIPGGGHRELWVDHEGHNLARWLSARGIAAFVLKYRLARELNSTYTVDDHALADTKRAIRLVRSRAQEWNIIYPGSTGRIVVTKDSPPAFLVCGYKERPDISQGLAEVYPKFKAAGVPAELHIYSSAGHGLGVRERNQQPFGAWPARFQDWLVDSGFLPEW